VPVIDRGKCSWRHPENDSPALEPAADKTRYIVAAATRGFVAGRKGWKCLIFDRN